jgi:PAS domain S-box-containing protein
VSLTGNIQKILAPMAFVMLAIVLGGTLLVIVPSFREVERQNARRITSSAMYDLTGQINSLDALTKDHASYEGMYDFVLDPLQNPEFPGDSFSDFFFSSQNISDVFVLNNSGDIIFEKSFDNETENPIPTREGLAAFLADTRLTSFTDENEKIAGVLETPDGAFLIAARPVVKNSGDGTAAGALVMASAFTDEIVSSISGSIGLPVNIYSYGDNTLPDELTSTQQPSSAAQDSANFYTKSTGTHTIAGYGIVYDIYGNPVMVLEVLIPRDIYHTSIEAIHAYMAFIILFHVISIVVSIYLIRHYIISRVQKTADFTRHVTDTNDLSQRLAITGDDELSSLEIDFNAMMDTLENAQSQLRTRQENEEELRRTIESVSEAIATADPDWNILSCNDASVSLLAYNSKQEIIGRNAMEFVAPCDIARMPELISRIIEQGYSGLHEVHMLKSNGTSFLAEISVAAVKNTRGALICFVTSSRDITARKDAEARLKAQYDIIERILAALPQAVLVVSEKGRIILANNAFYSIFNITEKNVKGKPLKRLLPVEELDGIISSALAEDRASFHVEFGLEINGNKHTYSAISIAMPPKEILLIFSDLTEIRDRTEKLLLNDRLASIGELAAGVAHELGSPLSSIIMFSELLEQQNLPQPVIDDIYTIETEAHRGADIIRNLLTFARRSGAGEQKTPVSRKLDAVLRLRAHELKLKNISIVRQIDEKLPDVSVDFTKMEQVFLNIIINAEQSMFAAHKKGTLTITASANEDSVKISFADDGAGISEENLKYIFDPFFTTKPAGEGTGLGLSICYGIVRQHGGHLSVSSKEGNGATFILELPAADGPDTPQG